MPQGERSGKPINKVLPFCPRATAEGMAGSQSVVQAGLLIWKQMRKFYGSMVRVSQKRVLYLSAGGSSNRKEGTEGQKGVRKTRRAANSGPCPKGRDGKCTPRRPHYTYCSMVGRSITKRKVPVRFRYMYQPKSVQLQERKSTYCSAI